MLANGVTDPENPVRPTNGLAAYPLGSAVKMARCAPERKVKLLPPPHRPPVLRLLHWLPLGRGGDQARMGRMTSPETSVRRKSRPAWR